LVTVGRLTPSRWAIRELRSPSAAANTIRLRVANPAAVLRRRAQRPNCSRSPSERSIATAFGPRELTHAAYHKQQ
jgi:hypothetical protein